MLVDSVDYCIISKPQNKYYISNELTYLNQRMHGIWFLTEINIGCFRRGPQNHGITSQDLRVRPWFVKVHYF